MKTFLLSMTICLLTLPQLTPADDLVIPPWRGQPGTTGQVWEFNTNQTAGLFPDGPPGGALPPIGQTQVSIVPHAAAGWLATDLGRPGVWPLSGEMHFLIENYLLANPIKKVQMQLVWRPQDLSALPEQEPDLLFINPSISSPLLRADLPLESPWTHTTYTWEYRPNPTFEEFILLGSINVDQVVIETWCTVPEPTTLALLALGGLAVMRRRR